MPRLDERLARAAAMLPAAEPAAAPAAAEPAHGPAQRRARAARATCGAWTTRAASLRVRDAKGMRHLALLLANPGVEFHAVDVATAAEGGAAPARARAPTGWRCRAGTGDAGAGARLPGQGASTARAWRTCGPRSRRPSRSTTPSARRARARRWSSSRTSCRPRSASAGATARAASAAERARVNVTRALRARDPAHRRRGRGPRARAGDDRPHRHLLRLRAGSPASGGVGRGCRLSASTSSSSARASAARSSRAGWRRRAPRCSCSSAGSPGRRAPSRARRASGAARCGRPRRGRHGLFEYHHFKGLDSLTASGLGGGSLIYANVMLRKDPETFAGRRPAAGARRPRPPLRRGRTRCSAPSATRGPTARPKTRALLDAARIARPERRAPAAGRRLRRAPGRSRFDDGAANLHGAAARDLPAVRRLRRGLPVRGQAHRRLHLPDARRSTPARACARAARRTRWTATASGWRVRYRQHLAGARRPSRAPARPGRAGRPRGARRSRRARRGHLRLDRPAAAQPRRAARG